ncbi:MAG: BrnT family toxin [Thermoflexaceae bacterium]|nr:BrnT family toxin [Thermoflexaceae bacterium]
MLDWDQHNEGHIREAQGVSREEAEDVLLSPDRFLKRADPSHGERRLAVIGTTAPGRALAVLYTHRA